MYLEFFRLREPPFSLTPDPRYFFMSERHREGLAHLFYGVQQPGGFVLLTGEVGCGKTTLCRCLVSQLPPDTDIALILNPRLTAAEMLASVCDDLGIPYPSGTRSIKVLVDALNQRLLESHARRRRTVLIIDEAQNLDGFVLEQIRLLTNLETTQEKLLQVILIGQPEFLSILKGRRLRQLAQRITARYHLMPLSRKESCAYIRHRLRVAGSRDALFSAAALRWVYRLSGGVPRVINVICDRALLGAYAGGRRQVVPRIVRRANREAQGIIPWYRRLRPAWTFGIVMLSMLLIGTAFFRITNPFARRDLEAASAQAGLPHSAADAAGVPAVKGESKPAGSGSAITGGAGVSSSRPESGTGAPADAAGADPAPLAGKPSGAFPAGPRLAELLANAGSGNTSTASFTALFARLGIKAMPGPSALGCEAARGQGFECLFRVGNWTRLRYYDLPAILELRLPSGAQRRVALVGLSDDSATLAIGDREYAFPLREIENAWDGSFILLWKFPFAVREIALGARGEDVRWVRRTLDALEGKAPGESISDLFDEELRQRILTFQRGHSLPQDGLVGTATLVRLCLAVLGSDAPSLTRHSL